MNTLKLGWSESNASARRSGLRSGCSPVLWRFANPKIAGKDKLARAQRRFLEIRRLRWKHLPACDFLSKWPNRPHAWEFAPQTFVMFFSRREPHAVVCRFATTVAQYQFNLVLDVHCKATEHGVGSGRQRRNRVQHKLIRRSLAR